MKLISKSLKICKTNNHVSQSLKDHDQRCHHVQVKKSSYYKNFYVAKEALA